MWSYSAKIIKIDENQGFLRILRFFRFREISKIDHDGYTHLELHGDVFTLENARFRGVWKSLNIIFYVFQHYPVGSVSSRSPDAVVFSKMTKNGGFWRFRDFMKSHSAIMTGIPIWSCAGMFFPSKTHVSEAF